MKNFRNLATHCNFNSSCPFKNLGGNIRPRLNSTDNIELWKFLEEQNM